MIKMNAKLRYSSLKLILAKEKGGKFKGVIEKG